MLEHVRLDATTDGSGDATVYGTKGIYGILMEVEWIDGDLADGVDAVLSMARRGDVPDRTVLTLTNANDDAYYRPRELETDNTGADATNRVPIVIWGTPKLVVSSGGDTKTGGVILHYIS